MERFSFVVLVAGLGFFALAFVVSGIIPLVPFAGLEVVSVEELARNVPLAFADLRTQYPEAFNKAFPGKTDEQALAEALVTGRGIYVGEGCWHCHTQQVRPVGGDEARFGPVHDPEEFNNALNYPPLWGTRRVGPDLLRESGRHSNDWHVAHFWNPPDVAPLSVMPRYPWFYEADGVTPNKKGLSIIAYVQWLGSWRDRHDENIFNVGSIDRAYPAPKPTTTGNGAPATDSTAAQQTQTPAGNAADDAYGDTGDPYGGDDAYGEGGEDSDDGY